MNKYLLALVVCLCSSIYAHDLQSSRVDFHAPIGVMGDHMHRKNEVMFSYRYMTMSMKGNRLDTSSLSISDVLNDYMMAPVKMTMDMHMFGAMYAPSDSLTLMAMLPYINKSMEMQNRSSVHSTMDANGVGDLKLVGLYKLREKENMHMHLNAGISLPLGSIDETGGQSTRLAYPMQLGSGTIDLILGLTCFKQHVSWSYGSQLEGVFRTGENKNGYTLGNQYSTTMWLAKVVSPSVSSSVRMKAVAWQDITGSDSELNPMMMPTAATNVDGKTVNVSWGLNYMAKQGTFKGHRLALEVGMPVYQSFSSVQLETEWWAMLGWQKAL